MNASDTDQPSIRRMRVWSVPGFSESAKTRILWPPDYELSAKRKLWTSAIWADLPCAGAAKRSQPGPNERGLVLIEPDAAKRNPRQVQRGSHEAGRGMGVRPEQDMAGFMGNHIAEYSG